MKRLRAVELQIIETFGDDPRYSLHRCDEHGVQAHRRDTEYEGCPVCKKKFPEQPKSDFIPPPKLNNKPDAEGNIKVFEISDNIELSKLQSDSLVDVAEILQGYLDDIDVGDEYIISIKVTKMNKADYDNLPEYQF